MTSINVSNLIFVIQTKMDETSSESDLLYYTKALFQLRTGQITVVNTLQNLPIDDSYIGSLYYVIDDETIYFRSAQGWTQLTADSATPIYSWGDNNSGRLGNGSYTSSFSPVREICSATDWCMIAAGDAHSTAIKTSGTLWAWGNNTCGRLGDGTIISKAVPVREHTLSSTWCQVSSAVDTTFAVKTDGTLWGWGRNICGQLGDGTVTTRCSPVREFCNGTNWCLASAGKYHTSAIKISGELWAWGCNGCGRLGDGTTVHRCSPVREFCSAADWCTVSTGSIHAAAIKNNGTLWAWGINVDGRLGRGDLSTVSCSPVQEFCSDTLWCAVGANSDGTFGLTSAIKTDGTLWSWGNNQYGQLGTCSVSVVISPVREFCSATNWCALSVGKNSSSAIKSDGTLWAWGCNKCGELGTGSTSSQTSSPVQEATSATDWCMVSINNIHTAAIKSIDV